MAEVALFLRSSRVLGAGHARSGAEEERAGENASDREKFKTPAHIEPTAILPQAKRLTAADRPIKEGAYATKSMQSCSVRENDWNGGGLPATQHARPRDRRRQKAGYAIA